MKHRAFQVFLSADKAAHSKTAFRESALTLISRGT